MSKNKHHRASTGAVSNAETTELTQQPTQEKTMEANQQKPAEDLPTTQETQAGVQEPSVQTAKQLALAEEENQARLVRQAQMQQEEIVTSTVPLSQAMAQGYEGLHEQFRQHNERNAKKKEYVPPPRTPNQMSRLEEELAAGAKAVARAAAQQAASRPEPPDGNKEGFTTPVYRPNDVVPDPILTGTGRAGVKEFGPDA